MNFTIEPFSVILKKFSGQNLAFIKSFSSRFINLNKMILANFDLLEKEKISNSLETKIYIVYTSI